MAPKPKLTAPCGVQTLATSSGVAPKVENREFYFDNIPPERSNRAFPMSRHDIRTTYILGLCRLRPETFVTGFDPSARSGPQLGSGGGLDKGGAGLHAQEAQDALAAPTLP